MAITRTDPAAADPAGESVRQPSQWSTGRGREIAAWLIVLGVVLLPVPGMLRNPGPPMEEGFMLVFPELVLRGWIPNKDFLHLYGPGSLWVLALVYKVFGADLYVERLFGLVQQLAFAFGVYAVARWWGRRVAVVCAVLGIVIMLPPAVLTAFAWTGAVALGLLGVAIGLHARSAGDDRRGIRLAVVAGVCFGVAFLFRLDLVIACALAIGAIGWGAPRRRLVALVGSATATASLVLVHFVLAGFGTAFRGMVLEPVFDLRPGRELPVPPGWRHFDGFPQIVAGFRRQPDWPLPTLAPPKQLFVWFFLNLVAIAVVTAIGIWAVKRNRSSVRARAVLAVGLFSLGIVSQSLQRPDSTHIAWVSCVSIAFLPIALMELLSARRRDAAARPLVGHRYDRVVACGVPVLAVALLIPNFTFRSYEDYALLSFGHNRESYAVRRGDRLFYIADPSVAAGANAFIDVADQYVRPDDRLFVGPVDLRKTATSEAWWYHLFPETTPGTRYIEMDPGIANAENSGLARELRTSDVAILSNIWREWSEPNESTKRGDPKPNRVLRRHFCPVGDYGEIPPHLREIVGDQWWFKVYVRCDRLAEDPTTP